jgi:hypothetical protein
MELDVVALTREDGNILVDGRCIGGQIWVGSHFTRVRRGEHLVARVDLEVVDIDAYRKAWRSIEASQTARIRLRGTGDEHLFEGCVLCAGSLDVALLQLAARRFAMLLDEPAPDPEAVLRVIEDVVNRKSGVDGLRMGLISQDEATNLFLAHFDSDLFRVKRLPGKQAWEDEELFAMVQRAVRASL